MGLLRTDAKQPVIRRTNGIAKKKRRFASPLSVYFVHTVALSPNRVKVSPIDLSKSLHRKKKLNPRRVSTSQDLDF